ncbi:MAG TPA: hypothetical protein VF403_22010 [Kofleriaceae bacterium]
MDTSVHQPDLAPITPRAATNALGPIRVMSNFFILERHRRGFTNYATR